MLNVVRSFDLLEGSLQSRSVLTISSETSMFAKRFDCFAVSLHARETACRECMQRNCMLAVSMHGHLLNVNEHRNLQS